MGQFIRTIFASCLGFILASILLTVLSFIIIGNFASSASKPKSVKSNSVLYLDFEESIPDKTNNVNDNSFTLNEEKILGLQEMVRTINNAKDDNNIKGIFLESDYLATGFASANSIRQALMDFKSEGKFIISYAKFYTQGAYFVATAADKIYLNPIGMVDFRGFSADITYYKDMLDKVGVKMEVFYAGKFKSATEPYRRNNMSEENRVQVREFLNDRYDNFLDQIADSRKITIPELRDAVNSFAGGAPGTAVSSGLIDGSVHRDEAISEIKDLLGIDEDDDINFITLQEYNKSNPPKPNYKSDNKIAVIYAEGTILDGEGFQIGSQCDSDHSIQHHDRSKSCVHCGIQYREEISLSEWVTSG